MDIGVIEHRVAAAEHRAVLAGLALEEHIDQPAAQIIAVRTVRQVETGIGDRIPDPVGIERMVHDPMANPEPAADARRVADDDHLGAVELDTGGTGGDRGVL